MFKPRHSLGLDTIDLKILAILQSNGRTSKAELAKAVNLSPTPCGLRLDKLCNLGIIRGYHADVDLHELADLSRFFVTVNVKDLTFTRAKRFEQAILRVPNITECDAVLGEVDFVMKVVATSVRHYEQIMRSLPALGAGEFDFTTYPSTSVIKRDVNVPLLKLETKVEPNP